MLRVVPLSEPPDGIGTLPLCAFLYFVRRGASCAACRICPSRGEDVDAFIAGKIGEQVDDDATEDRKDKREKLESSDDSILGSHSYDGDPSC